MSLKKVSQEAFVFAVFSRNQEKRSHWPGSQSPPRQRLRGSTIAMSLPKCRARTCGLVQALTRIQLLQNSGCLMVVFRSTTLSAWDRHWRNPREKNYRKGSNLKSARVSALTGSVPRKMAKARQRVPVLVRNRTHVARFSTPDLTTQPLVRINCMKKTVYDSSYFATCNWFFGVQDCRTRIFQVEYQGQTRNTRILERKPLINTSYCIRHRLELKYFHFA